MRATHTFILRLLFDTDEPMQLRGSLHSVANDADHTFANTETLLALLRELCRQAQDQADSTSMEKEET